MSIFICFDCGWYIWLLLGEKMFLSYLWYYSSYFTQILYLRFWVFCWLSLSWPYGRVPLLNSQSIFEDSVSYWISSFYLEDEKVPRFWRCLYKHWCLCYVIFTGFFSNSSFEYSSYFFPIIFVWKYCCTDGCRSISSWIYWMKWNFNFFPSIIFRDTPSKVHEISFGNNICALFWPFFLISFLLFLYSYRQIFITTSTTSINQKIYAFVAVFSFVGWTNLF